MLVGRATSGPYDMGGFQSQLEKSEADALVGRKALNRQLVQTIKKSSAFWKAFRKGSDCCGTVDSFQNAVWTNLAKIGYGTPKKDVKDNGALFRGQKDIAERTLRAELEEFNPTIVHFAVGILGGECIYRATGTVRRDWETLANESPLNDVWFLNSGHLRAIWTRHPNFAPKELVDAWTAKLQELIEA